MGRCSRYAVCLHMTTHYFCNNASLHNCCKIQSPDSPPSSQGRVSSEKSGSQMVKLDRPKKTYHLVRVAYIFGDIISSLHRILRSPSLRDLSNWNGISITGDQEIPPRLWPPRVRQSMHSLQTVWLSRVWILLKEKLK